MDYRNTLNLPNTSFPMRANLPQREPEQVKSWEKADLYHSVRKARDGKETFYLHDGPPYANGNIHMGTALNKILKDLVVKSKLLLGMNVHFRPGWDCHGLPIENAVVQNLTDEERETLPAEEIRRRCRNYALKFVDKHRKSFKRLGVMGEWERPYLTLKPEFEGEELRQFSHLVRKGYVYQGLKPVHWCPVFKTALAEAELEYEDHTSPSVFVRFPFTQESTAALRDTCSALGDKSINAVIWTTTPWTLPANRAVCLHPNFLYTFVDCGGEYLLIAKDLVETFLEKTSLESKAEAIGDFKGSDLEALGLKMKPPFSDEPVPMICGMHVTLEQGTGAVHTAPGHGHEDYMIGLEYKLQVFSPVDDSGCFSDESPILQGVFVEKANPQIVEMLRERSLLIHHEAYKHSYPYCWRSKKPIIFRATRQWFVSLETDNLRQRLLDAIDTKVQWIPNWGLSRIRGMVENRQEWCISRQRSWGCPIPAFYIGDSDEAILDADFIDEVSQIVQTEGTDFWFRAKNSTDELKRIKRLQELLPEGKTLDDVRLETDILDVWFDSGVSHHSVMAQEEGVFPVDLYLEGSDQHRGWFQSSLVTSIGAGHEPPYKTVLTHGFTVDENGRKLSKSLGNYVELDALLKETGADIIRLWVASEDFRNDVSFSKEILKRTNESYRRLRNTVRFILGNLDGYDPASAIAENERHELDRWALQRWRECKARILAAYQKYDFHRIVYDLNNFCSIDLSSQYLDIIKDRLYVSGDASKERLSAQTTLAEIIVELTLCTAPILSFTCEETWGYLKELGLVNEESVFFGEVKKSEADSDAARIERWSRIFKLRAEAVRVIEHARKKDIIGHSLDCMVRFETSDEEWKQAIEAAVQAQAGDELASVLIVSCVETGAVEGMPIVEQAEELPIRIGVDKAPGHKCPRCWHYDKIVTEDGINVCARCQVVLDKSK
ncbi:MAG: isoleucine--tRNA ligase [Candidatus Hinthialibacter antarcticus]|nr:isoleucine--tRNA ligase [Candidatus Hinthialibacter antarcticus]